MITLFFGDTSCLSRSVRTTCDNEHLTIISEWRKKKKGFTFQKCLKRSDRRIIKIEKKVFLIKEGVFHRLNQRIIPSRSIDIIFSILTETLQ